MGRTLVSLDVVLQVALVPGLVNLLLVLVSWGECPRLEQLFCGWVPVVVVSVPPLLAEATVLW